MVDVKLEPATLDHAAALAAVLRPADLAECLASGFASGLEALTTSFSASTYAWVLSFGGELAAVFGVVPLGGPVVCIWALTGNAVERNKLTFMRVTRRILAWLRRGCGLLVNLVDARYVAALQWLEVLGFDIEPPMPHPVSGLPFCRVSIGGV